jgi:hypothetical protein
MIELVCGQKYKFMNACSTKVEKRSDCVNELEELPKQMNPAHQGLTAKFGIHRIKCDIGDIVIDASG